MWLLLFISMMLGLWHAAPGHAEAAYADGVYDVPYLITKPDDDSVSIANDYFEKPAQIEIVNGTGSATIKVNHSAWITSLSLPNGTALTVLSANEEEDTRTVRLPLASLDEPALLQMHVLIEDIGYDHAYTVRVVFDLSGIDQASVVETGDEAVVAAPKAPEAAEQPSSGEDQPEPVTVDPPAEAPQAGQSTAEQKQVDAQKSSVGEAYAEPVAESAELQTDLVSQDHAVAMNEAVAQAETPPTVPDEAPIIERESVQEAEASVNIDAIPANEGQDEAVSGQRDEQSSETGIQDEEATASETEVDHSDVSERDISAFSAPTDVKPPSSGWSKLAVVGVLLLIPLLLVWRWIRIGRNSGINRR